MKFLSQFFQFYIQSSLHVALAVVAFTAYRMDEMNLDLDFNVLMTIFLASVSGYNFVKYSAIAPLHHRSLVNQLRRIQVFSYVALIGLFYFVFQMNTKTMIVLAVLAAINFLYAYPLFKNRTNLRNLAFSKIFVIAFVWSVTCIAIPKVENQLPFTEVDICKFIQQMLLMIALMIPFEIRDFRYDAASLRTLPQQLGVTFTKYVGWVCLLLSCIIAVVIPSISIVFSVVFSVVLGLFILFTKTQQPPYYASFFVEAVPVIAALIYFFTKMSTQ